MPDVSGRPSPERDGLPVGPVRPARPHPQLGKGIPNYSVARDLLPPKGGVGGDETVEGASAVEFRGQPEGGERATADHGDFGGPASRHSASLLPLLKGVPRARESNTTEFTVFSGPCRPPGGRSFRWRGE